MNFLLETCIIYNIDHTKSMVPISNNLLTLLQMLGNLVTLMFYYSFILVEVHKVIITEVNPKPLKRRAA